jgi:opacity protein-like surface antigen
LLRGVFSAPAALALYSGGAIAAASNQRCLASLQESPVPLPAVSDANVTYVRIGLYKRTSNSKYFVKGSDLQKFDLASGYGWPQSTQVRRFNISTNEFDQDSKSPPLDLEGSPSKWAALRIDGDGTVLGVGNSGLTGGSAIYHSCWTSFKVGFF